MDSVFRIQFYTAIDQAANYFEHIEAETKWPTFPEDIFKWIFLNENVWIYIEFSLKFVPGGPITIFRHWLR